MSRPLMLLVDDHAMFRNGLAVLLRMGMGDVEVTEADSVVEAVHATSREPALVLLDIQLNGLNGLEGIGVLKRRWPDTPVVIVSSDASSQTVADAEARGAAAFVSKGMTAEAMLAVVRRLLNGNPLGRAYLRVDATAQAAPVQLTPRQLEVLDLIARGLSNKAIGRRLDLSENTVRWHVQSVLASLQVGSRSEAVFAARKRGLIG